MQIMTVQHELDYEKLALVASKTENAVIITDKYGVTEWVNDAFTTITEFTFDEAVGKTPGQLLQGEKTDPEHIEAIRTKLRTGESFVQEILNYTKSGREYWLRLSITPIRNEFSEIVNYIAIESDITHEKKNQQALEKALKSSQEAEERLKIALEQQEELSRELMLADLKFKSTFKQEKNIAESLQRYRSDLQQTQEQLLTKEKMASIGLLTAGIAHEINNPINFISSSISALKALIKDMQEFMAETEDKVLSQLPAEIREKVGALKEEYDIEHGMEDIDQMLADAALGTQRTIQVIDSLRISARGDEDEKTETNINDLLDASIVLLKNQLSKHIKIEKSYGPLTEISCLPGPLSQVFTNLINNAIQAIPKDKKGVIGITTECTDSHQQIVISDNGSGIPAKYKDKIFEPSFTTKKVGEGTGLGMSISKEIIENRHQGTITFESAEGQGTAFTITIPKP